MCSIDEGGMEVCMKKIISRWLLLSYLFLLLSFIYIASGPATPKESTYLEKIIFCSNLVPFYKIGTVKMILTSLITYFPIGLLARDAFSYLQNHRRFYLCLILVIFSFELIQVITLKGFFDVNDIIFGFIGATLVYLLSERIILLFRRLIDIEV